MHLPEAFFCKDVSPWVATSAIPSWVKGRDPRFGAVQPRNVQASAQRRNALRTLPPLNCPYSGKGMVFLLIPGKPRNMKTTSPKNLMLALAAATLFTAPAFAGEPKPEFRIDEENFAKLNAQEQ